MCRYGCIGAFSTFGEVWTLSTQVGPFCVAYGVQAKRDSGWQRACRSDVEVPFLDRGLLTLRKGFALNRLWQASLI